jgi:hypothetical protein
LKFNQKPYVNASIFLGYIRIVFLPYIATLHELAVFAQEVAVFLMDNGSAHVTDDVIQVLTEARVRVITFAPDTTQVFQVLDLTLFGVLKRRPRYELPFNDQNATVKCIIKVYYDSRQTVLPSNVWGAFPAFEIEFDTRTELCRLLLDKEKVRGTAAFQELWSVGFPLDELWDRRRPARFGWINRPE